MSKRAYHRVFKSFQVKETQPTCKGARCILSIIGAAIGKAFEVIKARKIQVKIEVQLTSA